MSTLIEEIYKINEEVRCSEILKYYIYNIKH